MDLNRDLTARPSILVSIFRAFDVARRLLVNLIFFTLLIIVLALIASGGSGKTVPAKGILVLDLKGTLVEELGGEPVDRALAALTDEQIEETRVYDVIDALAAAKDDDRIAAVFLDLDNLAGGSLEKLQRLGVAIGDFKTSGKKVIAGGDNYFDTSYYLASVADEVYLHDMGLVLFDGFERFASFHKEGLDMYEVDWHVFRVGEYKSAVEPYLRDDMSEEAKLANREYLDDLWNSGLTDVAAARKLTPADLSRYVAESVERLQAAGGDAAKMALEAKLVDKIGGRELVRDRLIELGSKDDDTGSFQRIGYEDYLLAIGDARERFAQSGEGVAVIVASGTIVDGTAPPGTIGGDSTAALIREARNDDDVKAIVLRVDSGGGSAFASEVIRRECELARAEGKKVVISMGGVAASGGYWIATAADEIWASPNTITGSIGIFGMFPTIQKPLDKYLGTHVDGVGTTWLAGAFRIDRALDPRVGELIQTSINRGYEEFLARVGEARKMTREQVDAIARGRVWSGRDAKDRGLIDNLGNLDDAVASAAKLAELGDDYAVTFVEKERSFTDELLASLLSSAQARGLRAIHLGRRLPARGLEKRLLDTVKEHRDFLSAFDDPRGLYAHCLCDVR